MKKILYTALIGTGIALTSCGPTPCDCVKLDHEIFEKKNADGADIIAIDAAFKDKLDACKKMRDSKSIEDLNKARENCK